MLAVTEDALIGGANVSFDAVVVDFLSRLADITDQKNNAKFLFSGGRRGKFHLPKIPNVIKERDAISVNAGVRADLANHADFRFFVALGPAKNHFLFRRKLVSGNEAGPVETEQIGADQEDGDFLRDAAASAHNLLWQSKGHNWTASRTI